MKKILSVYILTGSLLLFTVLFSGCNSGTSPAAPAAATYAVTYDGNGADSGTVPSDSTEYRRGDTVTVLGNTDLAKGYHSFTGWNTAAAGTGDSYLEDDTFVLGASDVTLYAVWTANQYTISFDSNGGSSVTPITADYGSLIARPADPIYDSYNFVGWYKDASFAEAWDFASDRVPGENKTLYAKWITEQGITVTTVTEGDGDLTIGGPGSLDKGSSDDFYADSSLSYSSYTWYLNGTLITDATSSSVTIDTTSFTAGVYELTLVATDGDGTVYSSRISLTVTN